MSRFFLPTTREVPGEAEAISHRLMLRAGMVRQTAKGIYAWLPLGLRVLQRVQALVREEMDAAGAQEMLMPTLQTADLWHESGRYDAFGPEMLRLKDRNGRELIYGPTNEEQITDIFRHGVDSYQKLPLNLYHIQWKFRDEVRPRFGVVRCREFLMKDAYSFDLDAAGARVSYDKMFAAYLAIFRRLGLKAIPVRAKTGAIGGDLSHEFHVISAIGESMIEYDEALESETDIAAMQRMYGYTDDYDGVRLDKPMQMKSGLSAEIGHIFYLGTKYSEAMGATLNTPSGESRHVHMGCYGIGISRLVAAIVGCHNDDHGIVFPKSAAPFDVAVIPVGTGEAVRRVGDMIYDTLANTFRFATVYDDRDVRPGVKFNDMDLIGTPTQIVIGNKLESGLIEIKDRATGERRDFELVSLAEISTVI